MNSTVTVNGDLPTFAAFAKKRKLGNVSSMHIGSLIAAPLAPSLSDEPSSPATP